MIIAEAKTQVLWLAYDRWLQFSIRGASCDLGCSPWLCFRIGYKITITMNYLYSAFFCPPCQRLHDMYICACMYMYMYMYIYIYVCPDDCNKLSSIIISYHICEKEVTEYPSVKRDDGHGDCSVSLTAVLLAIIKMACCRRLRVVTVIDIICQCCCFLVVFLRLRNTDRTSS